MIYPDYNNCLVNLSCSILKEFRIENNNTLKMFDKLLEKKYKNIVVLVLDGMGKCILDNNLSKDGFFNSHLVGTYSSVFPPTTVAAITSIDSGKYPNESCYLGWDCYYEEIDKTVSVFTNCEACTNIQAAEYNVASTLRPYESIIDKINKNGGHAYRVTPYVEPYPDKFADICKNIELLCKKSEKKYIYSYFNEPDYTMHINGCYSDSSIEVLQNLENQVKSLCDKLEDTLFIITADHGHIDTQNINIFDYPKLSNCLKRIPSIEPRAVNFFVKEDKLKEFEEEFNKNFKDKFNLMPKEEVIKTKLFGLGDNHEKFSSMIGDYLAVAVSDMAIFNNEEEKSKFIGGHAGITEDEMIIPFIAIDTDLDKI